MTVWSDIYKGLLIVAVISFAYTLGPGLAAYGWVFGMFPFFVICAVLFIILQVIILPRFTILMGSHKE